MDKRIFLLTFAIVFTLATSIEAATIDFEGLSFVGNAYSSLGVSFNPNQQVCPGISHGDPGNWGLQGTNGPDFLCFNGGNPGYTMELNFTNPQSSISLDVSRSKGSSAGDFALYVYNGATLLDTKTVTLGDINTWSTVSITTASFNRVTWTFIAAGNHFYGVDNLIFVAQPPPTVWTGTVSFPVKTTSAETDGSGNQKFVTSNETIAGTMNLYIGESGPTRSAEGCYLKFLSNDGTAICINDIATISTESIKSKSEKALLIGSGSFTTSVEGNQVTGMAYIDAKATLKQDSSNNLISIGLSGKVGGGVDSDFVFSGTLNNTSLTKQAGTSF
jgi:hypothetical protein